MKNRRAGYLPFATLIAVLAVARILLAPWGKVFVFPNSIRFMKEASLPITSLIQGKYNGIEWPQPGAYPVLLKILRATDPADPRSLKTVLIFQVLFSTLTFAIVALAGSRLFRGNIWRASWALFFFFLTWSEFVYPWEPCVLAESLSTNLTLIVALLLLLISGPMRLSWRILFSLFGVFICMGQLRESFILFGLALILPLILVRSFHGRRVGPSPGEQGKKATVEESSSHSLPSPRNLSNLALLAYFLAMIIISGALWLHSYTRYSTRIINLGNFVGMRVLPDDAVRPLFVQKLMPPLSILAVKGQYIWQWPRNRERLAWMREYVNRGHLYFLIKSPEAAFRIFYRTSLDVIKRIGTQEQYSWPGAVAGTLKFRSSYLISRIFCSPVLLGGSFGGHIIFWGPIVLVLVCVLFNLRLGSARILPLALFLAFVFYSQYFVTACFDGSEDYRHALVGSLAVVLLFWMVPVSLVGRCFRK